MGRSQYLNLLKDYRFGSEGAASWLPNSTNAEMDNLLPEDPDGDGIPEGGGGCTTLFSTMDYISQYHDAKRLFLNHFENDQEKQYVSLSQIFDPQPNPAPANAFIPDPQWNKLYLEVERIRPKYYKQQTHALNYIWQSSITGSFDMQNLNLSLLDLSDYSHLTFRVGQDIDVGDISGPDQDFTLMITDEANQSQEKTISDFGPDIAFPFEGMFKDVVEPEKGFYDYSRYRIVMQTIRIPLIAFDAIDVSRIKTISFKFNKNSTGNLLFDDIHFSR
jgi:hypothetical protein